MDQLALEGGRPVRSEFLRYGSQWIDDSDIAAVEAALRSDWITQGPLVDEFERAVAGYCGVEYAVAVSSGTAALHAACSAVGVGPGDEAITTPMSFAATANAIVYCRGKPVFVDIEADTPNIDPEEIKRNISSRCRAVVFVDFAGHPADLNEITSLARERGLVTIEDACHALGAEHEGRKIGGLADMTVFSFHPVKAITTGEGGMVLTNNREYYEKIRTFRHHGIVRDRLEGPWSCSIYEPGYNCRITDFQCALGVSQLRKLDSFIQRRREIAASYDKAFADMEELLIPLERPYVKSAYHIYVIRLQLDKLSVGRKEIFEALWAENIGVNVHYSPIHLQPFYQSELNYRKGDFPKAERYYDEAITLPLFPKMNDEDVQDVIEAVRKVMQHYRR